MGDRAAEGPGLGLLGIDVDPLMVAGGVGEQVHLLLGDLVPVALTQVLTRVGGKVLDLDRLRHELRS